MKTIDSLLNEIVNDNFSEAEKLISHRDSKVLKNIVRLMNEPLYITENQGKLVVKVLRENQEKFPAHLDEIKTVTESPLWERNFRVVTNVRKVYVGGEFDYKQIVIESTFSSEIRSVVSNLNKVVSGLVVAQAGKKYFSDFTEKNIVALVEHLKPLKFTISDELKEYYETIKSWSKTDFEDQYRITTIAHPNFEKQIVADLGIETAIDQNIINDRSIRYQYFVKETEKNPKNLSEMIANRKSTKVWVDNNVFALDELFTSLNNLKRFPVLVVFDTRDSKKCIDLLKKMSESLEKSGISDGVGIYFRLDNDALGKEFNQTIAEKQYNCHLDHNTKIVGVQNGKIPKFLLKSDWKPMSVISLDHALRHSKTAVYANCCDLVVTYTNSEPIIETRYIWE